MSFLSDRHRQDLQKSGLTATTIARAQLHTGSPEEVKEILGYGTGGTGLVIPYSSDYARVKIDNPGPDAKAYRTKKGGGNRLYIPPDITPQDLLDPSKTLHICEGEKKALKAKQEGILCVALPGVWSWKRRIHGKSLAIPDLDRIEWRGRIAVIVFDSDLTEKPSVAWAEHELVQELRHRGAKVFVVRLPVNEKGLDDYLVTFGVEAFKALPMFSPEEADPKPVAIIERLSDVKTEPVEWLWRNRLARGKLCLLIGLPGLGKSMVTLDLISRMTKGFNLPDGDPPMPVANAIILSAEDASADTIKPRLEAAGADCNRVVRIRAIRTLGREHEFSLKCDLAPLEALVVGEGAGLIVIDPLSAYLGAVNSWSESEMRALLTPLAEMAERLRVAILGITHLTKSGDREVILRVPNSIAHAAAARQILTLTEHPLDREQRVLGSLKNNNGPKAEPLAFTVTDGALAWDPTPVTGYNVDEVLSAKPGESFQIQKAMDFLKGTFKTVPSGQWIPAKQVEEEAEAIGISRSSLFRARTILGINTKREGGSKGAYFWSLGTPTPPKGASPNVESMKSVESMGPKGQHEVIDSIHSIDSIDSISRPIAETRPSPPVLEVVATEVSVTPDAAPRPDPSYVMDDDPNRPPRHWTTDEVLAWGFSIRLTDGTLLAGPSDNPRVMVVEAMEPPEPDPNNTVDRLATAPDMDF